VIGRPKLASDGGGTLFLMARGVKENLKEGGQSDGEGEGKRERENVR